MSNYATDKKVLDIGSGGSSYGRFFPNRLTMDVSEKSQPDIVADAHKLPFENDTFEIVLCTEVLEHLMFPAIAISEMRRVLKDDGIVILTTRFIFPLHDTPGDYWRFTKYGLMELFKDWQIIELIPETTNFSTVAVILQRLVYQSRFFLNKLTKTAIFLSAWLLDRLNFIIIKQYGDIRKNKEEDSIMASGYYLVARKLT